MPQQIIDIKEMEVAFQRFNRYSDALLNCDFWTIKPKLYDLMSFCANNRLISFILDPIMSNQSYYNKPLRDLIIKDNRLNLGEDYNKYIIIFSILAQTASGKMDAINEFIRIFGETNKNQAVYKFNSHITKHLLLKLSNDFQSLYNKLSSKNKIELNDVMIYESYRVSDSSFQYNESDDMNSDIVSPKNDKPSVSNQFDDFEQLKLIINQNPTIHPDVKLIIFNDINDIMKILAENDIENGKLKIFNLINDIGLRSNWVIGKMDEKLSHPLISELVKIWALRQIGVRK